MQCRICNQLQRKICSSSAEFNEMMSKNQDILFNIQNYCVVPDFFPVCLGHALLISRKHVNSMMGNTAIDEFLEIKNVIREKIENGGIRVQFFEHGTGKQKQVSSASIYHAHLHIIPSDIPVSNDLRGFVKVNRTQLEQYVDMFQEQGYLFYENAKGEMFINIGERYTSQYFRMSYLKNAKLPLFDWKRNDGFNVNDIKACISFYRERGIFYGIE